MEEITEPQMKRILKSAIPLGVKMSELEVLSRDVVEVLSAKGSLVTVRKYIRIITRNKEIRHGTVG